MKLNHILYQSVLSAVFALAIVGCSSDDNNDNGANTDIASNDGPRYLVKSTSWATDDGISMYFVTDTLDENTVFDDSKALAIDGYLGAALPEGDNPDNAFYVGLRPDPVFQRYVVTDSGEIEFDKEISFANQGVSDGRNLMRSSKFVSAEKAYVIDSETLQILIFNPTEMTLIDTIDISDLDEEGMYRWSIFPTIDGDRVVVPITFYESDWSAAALSKLVIIDTITDTVTSDVSTQCGSLSASAKDAAGNIYFASHNEVAAQSAIGNASFRPCMIRMQAGGDGWDDSYYVNLLDLTEDGRPAMAVVPGTGDTAYTLIYSAEADAITVDNVDTAPRGAVWEFHSIELGNEAATVSKVDNVEGTVFRVQYGNLSHDTLGEVSWMMRVNDDWTESTVYNTYDPANWTVLTKVPGQIEVVGRLQ